ncbi:hypothetical protein [Pseudomonas sp. Q2-TVG4-2]|uniref:hypothetical protein n=1 Tax=Pseudomonas sp. Q2-TVG4-2 TaxID=1685699 RepID=UPI0015E65875|nr:hypothetical protein [Pseudomonas sp. Q2-TVG4-2]
MHTRNEQLAELLSLTTHGFSQLAEALVTLSFELMASEDPATRIASRRMVTRMAAIQSAFAQQLSLLEPIGEQQPAAPDTWPEDGMESPGVNPSDR